MGRVIDDATLATIEDEMRGDGVWIDPEFARTNAISAADETRLEELVASSDAADLRILLVDVDTSDDRFQGKFSNLAAWVHDSIDGDATYVGYERYGNPELSLIARGAQPETLHVSDMALRAEPDDFTEAIVRAEQYLADGDAASDWDALPDEVKYPWKADEERGLTGLVRDVGEGLSTGEWIAIGVGAVMVVLLVAVVWAAVRATRRSNDFVLPTAVLRSVRAAEDRQLRTRTESEVLALGEALAVQSPARGSGQAALDAWQEALDHYEAARIILDRSGSPADVVGALVLAQRGEDARRVAMANTGQTWEPQPTCWFNPLHTGRATTVTWRDGDRSVEVPACRECARDVEAGREVGDPLDFVDGEVTRHYYRLPLGAWSSTGFGSLEPDLLGALRRDGAQPRGRGVRGRLGRR